LWGKITPGEVEELDDAIGPGEVEELDDAIGPGEEIEHPPVHSLSLFQKFDLAASLSEVKRLQLALVESLPERYESCHQCGSSDLSHFAYPDEECYYCHNCGRESCRGVPPIPPAQVEELESAIASDEDFSQGCPECGGYELEVTPLGVNWQTKPDYYLVLCTNTNS
jgi:hypothetical protein